MQENQAPALSPSRQRRVVRPLVALAFLLVVVMEILLVFHLWRGHGRAEADALLVGSSLGQAVEQHVAGQLRGIDTLLDEAGVIVQAGHQHTPSVVDHLHERLTAFPELSSLVLVTGTGGQSVLVGGQSLPQAYLTWLQENLHSSGARLLVAPPLPAEGRKLLVARLFSWAGRPAALATLLDADSLAEYLQSVQVAETRRLSVVHDSGAVAAQVPDQSTAFGWPAGDAAQPLRVVLPVENSNLSVHVDMDQDRAFAIWRVNAGLQLVLLMAFCVVLYYWARRNDRAWRDLVSIRDGLEEMVERRGVELQKAREQLERRVRQVSAANRELRRLSMVTAHHLQEPLRPLVSYSQILARVVGARDAVASGLLDRLIMGGKDMKNLLKGFQKRVADLSIDAPAEMADLHMAVQRAMVDAGVEIPIRVAELPAVAVEHVPCAEVLVQVFRALSGLGAAEIAVSAAQRLQGWGVNLVAIGPLIPDAESSVAVRVCVSLASLNGMQLSFLGQGFELALETAEVKAAAQVGTTALPPAKTVRRARIQALGLIFLLAAVVAWQVDRERAAAIAASQVLTRSVANSIDQQISGSVRGIDGILAEVAEAFQAGATKSLAFSTRMEAVLRAYPEINFIGMIDAQGVLDPATWPPLPLPNQEIRVEDRSYFQKARRQGHDAIVVGDPSMGRLTHGRAWHLARPLHNARGDFVGLVLANVNPDHYARFLDRVLLDVNGGTALIGSNGLMIARAPAHAQKFGMDISSSDLFTQWLPQSPNGSAHLVSKADGNDKYLAYRTLSPYPLVVTSAVSNNKALGDWRRQAGFSVTVAALLSLALFALAWRSDRGMRRIQRQHAALKDEVDRRIEGLEAARAQSDARAASLERLNEQLHDVLAVITTQMDVPLTTLRRDVGDLRDRLRDCGLGTEGEELGYVASAVGRLSALLRDFQHFVSVIGATPRLGPLDLNALARLVADSMDRRFGSGLLLLRIEPMPEIVADATLLTELLDQLFSNAIAYRGRDEAVTVSLRLVRRNQDWLLQVSDDGPGLPPGMIRHDPQAFETGFGQAADSTGIGLAICRVIAQAHGGEIWLNNGVDGGAEVNVSLSGRPGI
ncbi:MAG: hypothetical protein BGO92_04345 [Magnetospirillum sp. 64-120]|uniref:ATP-binding protein n=1 Tax=Magnetospirillum sp. 64-120 TaxID=1895778 RepID=UPI00092C7D00|nr:ATP-binding protein [Magnetospirillum sp. 64-120]OJX71878.1 MAG: hypothetical protein BGO92_04345 [Magnetospirillum sp. 64-120]